MSKLSKQDVSKLASTIFSREERLKQVTLSVSAASRLILSVEAGKAGSEDAELNLAITSLSMAISQLSQLAANNAIVRMADE